MSRSTNTVQMQAIKLNSVASTGWHDDKLRDNPRGARTSPVPAPMRHDRSRVPADFIFTRRLNTSSPNATRELFRSCHPFPYGSSVDRVSRSRSIEWRNARDTPAPEITPATRTDGSIVGLRA